MNSNYSFIEYIPDQLPEVPADSIISRTLYEDEQVKTILFGFAVNQELSEHTASMPAMLYFVQGEARLTLGEDVLDAQAGTWVHMAPRLAHSIQAKTSLVMLLIMLKKVNDNGSD